MHTPSRRQFLKGASVTASAAAFAPSLLAAARQAVASNGSKQLSEGWQFRRGPVDGIWAVALPEEDSLWHAVALPHCVNAYDACDPDGSYFRGQGWYRTTLAVKNPTPGGRTVLHFQGAGQTTTVWVGQTLVGHHTGGYDEFVVDITDAVAAQPSVPLTVMCDNSTDPDRVPSDQSDFCLYGGLYRHVNLVYLPGIAIEAVHVEPRIQPDGSASVSVKSRLYNPNHAADSCSITVEVDDPSGKQVHRSTRSLAAWDGFAEIAAFPVAKAVVWSPDAPNLYRCRITLSTRSGEVQLHERFGMRQLEFLEHGPFKLNGQRLLLRGTQRHADHAGVAAAMSDDLVRQEMQLVKAMGCNFIRLAHYQQDRLVLELCDELGLMVWEEVPWCRAGVGGESFQKNAKDMLTNMIEQHYNHPSVILWGLGNEDDWVDEYPGVDQKAIRGFMSELRDLAHTLDGSRMTSFRRCDFARDIPDVYSPSIWAGWYRGNYIEYEQSLVTERERVKRLIHIEWGADSHAGRHSEDPEAVLRKVQSGTGTDERGLDFMKTGGDARMSKDGDWSESYACDLFDWYLKTQEKLDWLTGSAMWIFKDFASPLRADNGIPNVNQKGVIERDMSIKESYYVFQSYWSGKPMAYIYGHTWPVRWGKPGQQRVVKVYSNCESAELFLNGVSVGSKRRDSQDFPAAGLRWSVAFQEGENHLRVVATKGSAKVTDEIELHYQTQPWGKPARLKLTAAGSAGGVRTVEAKLYDAAGVLCLDARNEVRFSLAGAGRLIDNMGTSRGSRQLQLANGRARISFTQTGSCAVAVTSDGLPAALLDFASGNSTAQL